VQPTSAKVRSQNSLYVAFVRYARIVKLIRLGSRCVQNKEAHLCTTQWKEGYNPSVHRRYPRKPSSVDPSVSGSSDTSSTLNVSPPVVLQDQPLAVYSDSVASAKTLATNPITGPGFTIGQSSFLDMTIGSLLNEKDTPALDSNLLDQSLKYVRLAGKQIDEPNRVTSFCSPAAKCVETQHLQSLLPNKEMVFTITDYYHENMHYWFGGLYHGPSFRRRLLQAYASSITMDLQALDWRWTALLFAILSSGLIASPEALSGEWGYSTDDKVRLSREWGAAATTCLNLGNYTSQYHIYSIHAIYVLHAYEHLVGSTNQWIALRSVALVIARGLGLHKLGPHPEDQNFAELTAERKQAFIDREIGRRTWSTIASQEWLCSTTQANHQACIQKRQFTTVLPMHVEDETMYPLDENTPSLTLVGRYLYDYASLLLEYHNAMVTALDADDATRYAMILKFDGELRVTSVEKVPKALSSRIPLDPAWPKWTKWARTLHQASINHKIIMLHQSFLSKSFKDVRYTYTRWACATAAKTLIGLYTIRDPNEPQWWVEQAFVITSGICLLMDLFHRPNSDTEVDEYLACVQQAIRFLQQFVTSSVAIHGVRLLCSLLQEYNKLHEGSRPQNAPAKPYSRVNTTLEGPDVAVHDRAAHEQCMPDPEVPLSNEEAAQFNFDIDLTNFEDLMEWLPVEGGLDNNVLLDSISGLATGQISY
jgi:hypothetical protein